MGHISLSSDLNQSQHGPVSSQKPSWWKAIAGVKNFFSPSLQVVGINSSQLEKRRGMEGGWGACNRREGSFSYLLHTITALCLTIQVYSSTRSVNCCQYADSLHLPIMTGTRRPILSTAQVAVLPGGNNCCDKEGKPLVCLWGVNGERHWRQEVLRKWKALYCAPEWPGVGFLPSPMGKPHYRAWHRVITAGQWSSSDPLH